MTEPNLPLDSLILVTAANGLIASHAADQLLAAGYRVRGTVRDEAKCQWMTSLFDRAYGPGKFELVRISTPEEMADPKVWDEAFRGVSGVAHVLGQVDLSVRDVDAAFAEEWPVHAAVLNAAKRFAPAVKAFAFTSSAWAAYTPDAAVRQTLTGDSWNEEALAVAARSATKESDPSQDDPKYMLAPFMALKTRLEQAFWQWVEREQPGFACNSILLAIVMGRCLDPTGPRGVSSTAGMVRWVWDGLYRQVLDAMQPQWHVDTGDAGRLYVAALTRGGVDRERIYGFGERFSWFQVRQLLSSWYADCEKVEGGVAPVANLGRDQTDVPNERGAELLRRLGRPAGWTGLEESVRANMKSIFELEKAQGGGPSGTLKRHN
ncbi:NAD-dependent epimerase/dehydratase N-terminal domain [Apiospora arundinis]|uniref:NAD-dependent epimerase/dehydratase N-terminal domain n=1 Tax=Apiospora arundinis TaxID=335852 RepID=A0ABR2JIQ0_9PEZI